MTDQADTGPIGELRARLADKAEHIELSRRQRMAAKADLAAALAELAAARDQEVERLRLIRRRILNTVDPAMPSADVRLAAVAVVEEAANALAALSQSGQPTKGEPA